MASNEDSLDSLDMEALHITDESSTGPKQRHLTKKNRCYLISNRFGGLEEAVRKDEEKIKETFEEFNFTVKMNKEDLTAEEIKQYIHRNITERDFDGDQCLVLYLISHGTNKYPDTDEKNGVYMFGCDWQLVDVLDIVNQLQNIPSLIKVPKLVFANFCRGDKNMETVKESSEKIRAAGGMPKKRARKADTLVFYASTNGYKAWLEPQNISAKSGTFFTNAVCDEMKNLFKQNKVGKPVFHLNDLVMKVNQVLSEYYFTFGAQNKEGNLEPTDYIQMSEACSTLTENIYFYSKEI